uniref:Uncharacterized protein n=1 Tax=Kuenenia stuttgartiensis TaxID=174633 RepID=Q1PWD0_KUEST|nr:unknown protein [Candidatus Kuenenia stuttgartiensis]
MSPQHKPAPSHYKYSQTNKVFEKLTHPPAPLFRGEMMGGKKVTH